MFLRYSPKKSVGNGQFDYDGNYVAPELKIDGVFFLRNSVAPATVLKNLEMNGAHIVINRSCKTNIEGCFAAGDCTGRPYQIAKAVGEGNIAAHSIVEYLAEQ